MPPSLSLSLSFSHSLSPGVYHLREQLQAHRSEEGVPPAVPVLLPARPLHHGDAERGQRTGLVLCEGEGGRGWGTGARGGSRGEHGRENEWEERIGASLGAGVQWAPVGMSIPTVYVHSADQQQHCNT